jgi:hypothetical protein
MGVGEIIGILANFLVVVALIVLGLRLFAQYYSRGQWAKNITALLAGCGLLTLAFALMITPRNAEIVVLISRTKAYVIFLVASNALLLSAIAAYGLITYWKPLRLLHERKIERDLKDELPKVP